MSGQIGNPAKRLTVAMIARDEEAVIGASLESVREWADEIVLLDTGSRDQTPAVARRFGATVHAAHWTDDFAAARNAAARYATCDWILWLDAGERLLPDSAPALHDFLRSQAAPDRLYTLMVEWPAAEPGASAEQIAQPRLMPNRPELTFAGRVRESVLPSAEAAGIVLDSAPGRLLRHRRHRQPEELARRAQRDLALAQSEAEQLGGCNARIMLATGEAHANLGRLERARGSFAAAVRLSRSGTTEMLQAYYGLLAAMDGEPSLAELQVQLCLEALTAFPFDAQLLLAMGHYLERRGELGLARRSFEAAVRHGMVNLETWHLRELAEVAASSLSILCQLQDDWSEAQRVLDDCLGRHPHSRRLLRRITDLLIAQGRTGDACRRVDAFPLRPSLRPMLRRAVEGACHAARGELTAALGLLQSAYLEGCTEPWCLKWLALTLLGGGQWAAAELVLREWRQAEPRQPEIAVYQQEVNRQRQGEPPAPLLPRRPERTVWPPEGSAERRWYRLDPATTTVHVGPVFAGLISQVCCGE